jgi:hypothetical protein
MNDKAIPVVFLAFANDKEDNTQYLRKLTKELNQIREELKGLAQAGLCEIVERSNISMDELFDVFQDIRYHGRIKIFHYGGHANSYQLLLEDSEGRKDEINAENLNEFLGKQGLQLIFLNACSTKLHAEQLLTDVPAIIATSQDINDDVATQLAVRFYHAVANHIPLQTSFSEAVSFVNAQNKSGHLGGLYRKDLQNKPAASPWQIHFQNNHKEIKEARLLLLPIDISYNNPKILNVLVLATDKDKWKPYPNEKEISALMEEYQQESHFHTLTYYVEDVWLSKLNQDKKFKTIFKNDVIKRVILLIDGFALSLKEHIDFAKLFDTLACGGVLVPICQERSEKIQDLMRSKIEDVFEELHTYYYQLFDKQCVNIELEVPTKKQLFRRLTNMAVKSLGMSEIAGQVEFPPNIEKQRATIPMEKSYLS